MEVNVFDVCRCLLVLAPVKTSGLWVTLVGTIEDPKHKFFDFFCELPWNEGLTLST